MSKHAHAHYYKSVQQEITCTDQHTHALQLDSRGNEANVDSGVGLNLPHLTTTPLNFSKTIRATASPLERSIGRKNNKA